MSEKVKKWRILAIHAHPDDLELQCAGSLLKLRELGHDIALATMTAGDKGSANLEPEEISRIRRAEAETSAALLGAEYHCAGLKDLEITFDVATRRLVTEIIRKVRPDLVITAPPSDYMADHEITSQLVRDACFAAPIRNYKTRQWDPAPPTTHLPSLIYCDPIDGLDAFGHLATPDFIVDISEVINRKLDMLACHSSQRDWLRQQHGMDEYLEACRRFGARQGARIGKGYGEGFRRHCGHPYPVDNRFAEALNAVALT